MNKLVIGLSGAFCLCALVAGSGLAQAEVAQFDTTVQEDNYWGDAPGSYTDTVAASGDDRFDIDSIQFSKDEGSNALNVVITTKYADTVAADSGNTGAAGTKVGSLFIGLNTTFDLNGAAASGGTAPENTADDRYSNDTARYNWVVTPDQEFDGTSDNLDASLYTLAVDGSGDPDGSDVQLSYYPDTDRTTGSNFRNGQAVGYTGSASATQAATWSVDKASDQITFSIANFFGLDDFNTDVTGQLLTVAWAMTCANDVVMYTQALTQKAVGEVPVPAGLVLLLSGLVGLGFLGRYKNRTG